jgi:uncharacterized protein involved in response to NO
MPRQDVYAGPAILSYGFRPFFLAGALYAALAVMLWLPMFFGEIGTMSAFAPRDWHIHEMLYGYLPAVVTGFLFTAIPNWTGRLPLRGGPLLGLFALWLAGRVAVSASALIGWAPAAAIDCAFLVLVVAVAAREIVAGKNWRNLRVVVLVSILAAGNIAFHLQAHFSDVAEYGTRLGIATAVMLVTVIGGRVVPTFTHNWLVQANPGRLPASFGRFDVIVILFSAAALLLWIVDAAGLTVGTLLLLAGVLHLVRLARWAGDRTLHNRLVLILHVGYAFVPVGFLLMVAAAMGLLSPTAGIHAWAGGAVGVMTIAVMTRASLGHTGKRLEASLWTQAIYAAVVLAAIVRTCAALHPAWSTSYCTSPPLPGLPLSPALSSVSAPCSSAHLTGREEGRLSPLRRRVSLLREPPDPWPKPSVAPPTDLVATSSGCRPVCCSLWHHLAWSVPQREWQHAPQKRRKPCAPELT